MSQIVGLVLAGGEGFRMGEPKGPLVVQGRSLADRAAGALRPLCGSVLISVARGGANPAPGYPTVEDRSPPGGGPLAGIEAAFAATGAADLLVLACDYPRVGTDLLRAILDAAEDGDDLVILTDPRGRDHPLVGLWRRAAEPVVGEALARRQRKVRALLAELEVRRLRARDLPEFDLAQGLVNVNTPDDLLAL